jgi:iron(III) transport system ATP-binding protein
MIGGLLDRVRRLGARAEPTPAALRRTTLARSPAAFSGCVTFENVSRSFGSVQALRDVSLRVEAGEIVCLLGPSGCGKTTLLRIASGVDSPSAGRVLIDGVEIAGPNRFVPPEKRGVGLMFQDFALFPHLTIRDNVAFGLKALARDVAAREAEALLSRVGLLDYADAYPDMLSGGQQQRVALIRALAPRPAVILMDEPFSGLDVQLREAMQKETRSLLKETGATCILVTHDPVEALRMADRIAVVHSGRVVQFGTGEELYRHPNTLFVARLFSEINEIHASVDGGSVSLPLGSFEASGLADGEPAVVCIRRRALRLAGERPEGTISVPGRVLSRLFQGDYADIEVGVQGFDAPLRIMTGQRPAPVRGADVWVSVDPAGVRVFPDRADGLSDPEQAVSLEPPAPSNA